MARTLIATGDSGVSPAFAAVPPDLLPATLMASTFAGAETIAIEINAAGVWVPLVIDGTAVVLSATNNAVTIYGPGSYRGNKSGGTAILSVAFKGAL